MAETETKLNNHNLLLSECKEDINFSKDTNDASDTNDINDSKDTKDFQKFAWLEKVRAHLATPSNLYAFLVVQFVGYENGVDFQYSYGHNFSLVPDEKLNKSNQSKQDSLVTNLKHDQDDGHGESDDYDGDNYDHGRFTIDTVGSSIMTFIDQFLKIYMNDIVVQRKLHPDWKQQEEVTPYDRVYINLVLDADPDYCDSCYVGEGEILVAYQILYHFDESNNWDGHPHHSYQLSMID